MGSNTTESWGRDLCQPRAMASAEALAVSVLLNLSGMIKTFTARLFIIAEGSWRNAKAGSAFGRDSALALSAPP